MNLFPTPLHFLYQINKVRDVYINYEKQNLENQVRDQIQTITINK